MVISSLEQIGMPMEGGGGGVLIYVREDICREINYHKLENTFEGIFLEINL